MMQKKDGAPQSADELARESADEGTITEPWSSPDEQPSDPPPTKGD